MGDDGSLNAIWARAFVEEVARAGVREVCLSPGSRSTPLVLACAGEPRLRTFVHLDERASAYFALGIGKATGRPALVVTTSGTAAANLLPAVVEASQSEAPLLVATADRPARLRGADANQTIDQHRLYGVYARAFFDVPEPDGGEASLRHLRAVACRAVALAVGLPAGSVHLNLAFAKPLEPLRGPTSTNAGEAAREEARPHRRVTVSRPAVDPLEVERVAEALRAARRPLLVAGPVPEPVPTGAAARRLAEVAGMPLLADPLSGARFRAGSGPHAPGRTDRRAGASAGRGAAAAEAGRGGAAEAGRGGAAEAGPGGAADAGPGGNSGSSAAAKAGGSSGPDGGRAAGAAGAPGDAVLAGYDLFLRDPEVRAELAPDFVLRVGAAPTSSAAAALLDDGGARQVVVDAGGRWKDHLARADDYVRADPAAFLERLAEALDGAAGADATAAVGGARPAAGTGPGGGLRGGPARADGDWLGRWRRAEACTREVLSVELEGEFFEGTVLAAVVDALADGEALFVSGSMPVRDLDAFGARAVDVRVFGNRGASGIDGIVSTALGVAAGGGGRVTAVLGDIAFYHDMNGLLAAREKGLDVTFVVIHNDGGGIFHLLPIREHEPAFTPFFATPHGLDFRHAAALYGLPYARVEGRAALVEALEARRGVTGCGIVEVRTDREINRRRHEEVAVAVRRAVAGAPAEGG